MRARVGAVTVPVVSAGATAVPPAADPRLPRDSRATDAYSSPDGYGPRRYPAADRPVADRPGESDRQAAGGRRGSRPAERDLGARDPGTGERGSGRGDRDFGAGEPNFSGRWGTGGPAGYDFDTDPGAAAAGDLGAPAASSRTGTPGPEADAGPSAPAGHPPIRAAPRVVPAGTPRRARRAPESPEGYDDAPTAVTKSSFSAGSFSAGSFSSGPGTGIP